MCRYFATPLDMSVPAPAALCPPVRAVFTGHTQPLWDLLSPAWMCQLGSGPRPVTGPVTPAYLQFMSPPLCHSCCFSEAANLVRALHSIPLGFRKKGLSAARVLWMQTSFLLFWRAILHLKLSLNDAYGLSCSHLPVAFGCSMRTYSRHCTWLSKLECVTLRDMSSLVVRWGR